MTAGSGINALRWIVFVLNLLFWLAGMGVLGVSLWLLFDADFARVIGHNSGLNNFYTGVYIMLAVGLLMSLLGFLGCCGALRRSQICLTLFFILLLVVFIAELVCGILMYYYQEDLRKYVEDSMTDAVKVHYGHSPYTEAVDKIQSSFQCCGARSYNNWLFSKYVQGEQSVLDGEFEESGSLMQGVGVVPKSCCTPKGLQAFPNTCGQDFTAAPLHTFVRKDEPEESFIFPKGCNQALYDYYYDNSNVLIGLAIGIGCIQLLGMVLTMLLCCCVNNDERKLDKTRSY